MANLSDFISEELGVKKDHTLDILAGITISEAKKKSMKSIITPYFKTDPDIELKTANQRRGKGKEDFRLIVKGTETVDGKLGDPIKTTKKLVNLLDSLKEQGILPSSFTFSNSATPGDYSAGSSSSKYYTYIFKYEEDGEIKDLIITHASAPGKSVRQKEFTPNKVLSAGLLGDSFHTLDEIVDDVEKFFKSSDANKNSLGFMKELVKLVDESADVPVIELESVEKKEEYSMDISNLDTHSLELAEQKTIMTDFGEVLAGMILAVSGYEINFPEGANVELIDLKARLPKSDKDIGINMGVSVKQGTGAKASIGGVIRRLNEIDSEEADIESIKILKVVEKFSGKGAPIALFSLFAKEDEEFKRRKSIIDDYLMKYNAGSIDWIGITNAAEDGEENSKLTSSAFLYIEDAIMNAFDEHGYDETLEEDENSVATENTLKELLTIATNLGASGDRMDKKLFYRDRKKIWGYIWYPMLVGCVGHANEDMDLRDNMDRLLRIIGIKQLYLIIKKDQLKIVIKNYGATGFKFAPGPNSAATPANGKMAFNIL